MDHGQKKTTTPTLCILVVDDESDQLESICRGLFLFGYETIPASNGASAFEALEKKAPHAVDLLVTDLTMPRVSGFELITAVQRTYPALPIIAVTGLAPDPRVDVLRAQGILVLQKPFSPDQLNHAVCSLVGRYRP